MNICLSYQLGKIGGYTMIECNIQNCHCQADYKITYQHTPKSIPRNINICENHFNSLNVYCPEKITNVIDLEQPQIIEAHPMGLR